MPRITTLGGMSSRGLGQFAKSEDKLYVEDVFSTYLYTGNGSTQTITNGIDLAGKGGMVWIKNRNSTEQHRLYDTTRDGALSSELTNPQSNGWVPTYFNFNTNGFFVNNSGGVGVNTSSNTYASWTFRKAPKFFDVVTYTGTGAAQTIAHSLGIKPGFIVQKRITGAASWHTYHQSLGATQFMTLNGTSAAQSASTIWNNTEPTSTHFTVGSDQDVNGIGYTYVAYLFAHDTTADGIVQCGSFTTSGETTVNLGFEPQFVLIKRTDGVQDWQIYDTMRGMAVSSDNKILYPNTSDVESSTTSSYFGIKPSATGFVADSNWLGNARSFIYLAIRRGPMRTPTDATKVFMPVTYNGDGSAKTITTDFPVDLEFTMARATPGTWQPAWFSRLVGNGFYLQSSSTAAEVDWNSFFTGQFQSNTGIVLASAYTNNNGTSVMECFRRAPGFFDVVCYTGTGSARTVSHNLGVAPELMIVKRRDTTADWQVYAGAAGEYLVLNSTAAKVTSNTDRWNNTAPTASVFSLGTNAAVNASGGTYVAYLFASCPGVSKVGSYTGTGTTQQIDCGFTAGARFVLIKRTDSTGGWWVYDSARGIVAGNDPYLFLNSTAAEVTSTDYVDAYAAGFELSSTAPAGLNANGGTYIFLAIA